MANDQRAAASATSTTIRGNRSRRCAMVLLVCVGVTGCASPRDRQPFASSDTRGSPSACAGDREDGEVPVVLFLCPHNASKSVMAASHFQRLADERGLRLRAASAGTDPNAEVDPRVTDLLRARGVDVEDHRPRQVTPEEMQAAHLVVSLGCDLSGLRSPQIPLVRWDDIPPPSQDLSLAHDEIVIRVERLVNQLDQ